MTDDQVNNFLEHFGVRGMRWGVRNEEKLKGDEHSDVQKALKANPSKPLSKEQKRQLEINQKKHDSHFEPSEAEQSPKGWRPTKKQVVIGAATVAVGAAAAAAIIYKTKSGGSLKDIMPDTSIWEPKAKPTKFIREFSESDYLG